MLEDDLLRKILADPKNFDKLIKIAENYGIQGRYGEGVNRLDEIFEKVFTGNLPPEKVEEEIKMVFGFSDELCKDLAKEMENQIFSNYKAELEKLYKPEGKESLEKIETEKKEVISEIKENPQPQTQETQTQENQLQAQQAKEEKLFETKQNQETVGLQKESEVDSLLKELEKELEKEKQEKEFLDNIKNLKDK
jgi:hypothetical protein